MLLLAAKPTLWISNQVYFFVWTSLITESFVIYPMKVLIYVVFCCNSLTWEVFLLGRHLFFFFQYAGKWRWAKKNSSELSQLNSSENNSKLAIGQKGDIKICAVLKYIFCQSHLEVCRFHHIVILWSSSKKKERPNCDDRAAAISLQWLYRLPLLLWFRDDFCPDLNTWHSRFKGSSPQWSIVI